MSDLQEKTEHYRRLLSETRELYRDAARRVEREHPELVPIDKDYVALLEDLHSGLVLRLYVTICKADQMWTDAELRLAEELCEHLWGERLTGGDLNRAIQHAIEKTESLAWETLVRPFAQLAPLREKATELETLIVRQSNLIARIDGVLAASETAAIKRIAKELNRLFGSTAVPEETTPTASPVPNPSPASGNTESKPAKSPEPPTRPLDEVLADLDRLVGLAAVKQEVRSLANYLSLQRRRGESGLPTTDISLHLVFTGNPGTGKTTVARLFGEAMRAMGVLPNGRLIETERSGLVACYAGQTAPKTNEKVDEAIGGVLFIDEAYGLLAAEGDDPFGQEAIQTLLKRAEDDRRRLAIVLAGYPNEMTELLQANPGLASRFSRTIRFEDYRPLELCQIFGRLMEQHHYHLSQAGRLRVIQAITALHADRDRHFGNGRAVRNLFERAILQMANRLASEPELTDEQLITLEADDIPLDSPATDAPSILIVCPRCEHSRPGPAKLLALRVKCPACGEGFASEWCELI